MCLSKHRRFLSAFCIVLLLSSCVDPGGGSISAPTPAAPSPSPSAIVSPPPTPSPLPVSTPSSTPAPSPEHMGGIAELDSQEQAGSIPPAPTEEPARPEEAEKETTEKPEAESRSPEEAQSGGQTYVLNTSTKVFHYPSCGSVKKMKDKNKQISNDTREEIIASGYKSCGNCHP